MPRSNMSSLRFLLPLALALSLARISTAAEAEKPSASPVSRSFPVSEALFVRRVLPIFREKCMSCHGDDEKKLKSGFDMRSLEGLLKGGDSGEPALAPGKPEESPLYLAASRTHKDWKAMPPKENDKLTDEQLSAIRQWIAGAAPWPDEARRLEIANANAAQWAAEDGASVKTSGGLSPEWTNRKYKPENLWAYQPLKTVIPPNFEPQSGARSPIDLLIDAKLAASGLAPAPLADRRTLIRRATFDLLGLPPRPEDIDAFLGDPAPDGEAFSKVVERLLASPHYGEQWGRHWLDVARYADSSGLANDYLRGNAWRYRDYVVRAFNADKPYDDFIREQIAGDEIAEAQFEPSETTAAGDAVKSRAPASELLIAAGFLRMGPWELSAMEVPRIARQRFLDDVTQSVGETFLAHAVQCARCHDHKFDPIPTRDYYSLQAVFATTQLAERPTAFLPLENTSGFEEKKYVEQRRDHYLAILHGLDEKSIAAARAWMKEQGIVPERFEQTLQEELGKAAKRGREAGYMEVRAAMMRKGIPEDQVPPKQAGFLPEDFGMDRIARKGLERLAWELDRYEPIAFSVYSGRTPDVKSVFAPIRIPSHPMEVGEIEQTSILPGGDPFSPTLKVVPAVLSAVDAIANPESPTRIPESIGGRRKALAEWIASPKNPLTPRVMVNRIWLWHFGQAIAGNPNNFGFTGKKPSNPELLDWLAAAFIQKGWSVKAMHRLIMNSEAYRRASQHPDPKTLAERDPSGASFAVFKPRRLAAEELRDSMLSVTGELNPEIGGIPVRPEMNLEAALQPRQVMGTFAEAWQPSPKPAQRHRRSLYALHIRGQRDPFLEVFNDPSPDLSCERREASTVTPQVFALFNSKTSYERALAFANRVLKETASPEAALARIFQLAFARAPKPDELQACLAHWTAMTARHRTLKFAPAPIPREVVRTAIEENTGEKFSFSEPLEAAADFVPDLGPADASPELRGLAEVCLVLLNTNEFAYVY
jgi:hypothetical protein